MFKMETIEDLWQHIAYVLGCAPDNFPIEDFLEEQEQMNLDKAFVQLRNGVDIAYPENQHEARRQELNIMLDECYQAYKYEKQILAGNLLNKFENAIFQK